MYIRWVDSSLQDHEDFVEVVQIRSLVFHIKDALIQNQCYDGAINTSGIKNGVAAQIISEEKCAIYTQYNEHSLNLHGCK